MKQNRDQSHPEVIQASLDRLEARPLLLKLRTRRRDAVVLCQIGPRSLRRMLLAEAKPGDERALDLAADGAQEVVVDDAGDVVDDPLGFPFSSIDAMGERKGRTPCTRHGSMRRSPP